MDNNTVKENIIRRRKRLKLSQQDVAEKIGMSRTAYRNIEKGDTRLLSENIGKIADAFGVAAEELVLGYDADPEHDQTLCDGISYKRMYEDLRTQYNADSRRHSEEIARLMTEIATLKDYIAMQKDLIGTKDEINHLHAEEAGRREIVSGVYIHPSCSDVQHFFAPAQTVTVRVVAVERNVEKRHVLEKDFQRARETHVPERRSYHYPVRCSYPACHFSILFRHYPAVAVVQYPAVYGRKAGSVEADSLDFVSFRQLRYQRTGDSSGTGLFPHGGIYKYKSAHILHNNTDTSASTFP